MFVGGMGFIFCGMETFVCGDWILLLFWILVSSLTGLYWREGWMDGTVLA